MFDMQLSGCLKEVLYMLWNIVQIECDLVFPGSSEPIQGQALLRYMEGFRINGVLWLMNEGNSLTHLLYMVVVTVGFREKLLNGATEFVVRIPNLQVSP